MKNILLKKAGAVGRWIVGGVWLLLALYLLGACLTLGRKGKSEFDHLPDYDYRSEILALEEAGKLMEAEQLADFVLSGSSISNASEIATIRDRVNKNRTSKWKKIMRTAKGFATGEGESVEELTGSIASDLCLWGDVRDLCKQGYFKVTGKESDNVVLALAGLGVATEFVDVADWAPAVLKAFKKVGSLSRKFCDNLVSLCRKSVKAKKIDGALADTFKGVKQLCNGVGTARAATIMKYVDDAGDLKALSKVAAESPDAVALVVRHSGRDGVDFVRKLADTENASQTLALAARKGPNAISKLVKNGVREIGLAARISKNFYKGKIFDWLKKILPLIYAKLATAVLALGCAEKSARSFIKGASLFKTVK